MFTQAFTSKNWGPQDPRKYKEWEDFKTQKKRERKEKNETVFQYIANTLLGR